MPPRLVWSPKAASRRPATATTTPSTSSTGTASTPTGPGSSKGRLVTGRGLTAALSRRGEWVIEFDRPTRKTKDGAKSDALDAVRAAREVLGRKRLSIPRAHDGVREAIRVHAVTRAAAVRARTAAINELKALIVTAEETLRSELCGLRTTGQVAACAKFRDRPCSAVHERATRDSMRSIARRVQLLDTEIDEHDL